MYADTSNFRVIRIGPDGSSTFIDATLPRPDSSVTGGTTWNAGDVDPDGNFWVASNGRQWARIDANPASSTFGTVLQQGTSTAENPVVDWTYVPGGGRYLYGLAYTSTRTRLARWSLDTFTWEIVRDYGNIVGSNLWGANYAVGNGIFYASENSSGDIYRFDINSGAPVKVTAGPSSSNNDGARCFNA
ncbi:hypothetical protein FPOAC2_11746 [Fusarium poae]